MYYGTTLEYLFFLMRESRVKDVFVVQAREITWMNREVPSSVSDNEMSYIWHRPTGNFLKIVVSVYISLSHTHTHTLLTGYIILKVLAIKSQLLIDDDVLNFLDCVYMYKLCGMAVGKYFFWTTNRSNEWMVNNCFKRIIWTNTSVSLNAQKLVFHKIFKFLFYSVLLHTFLPPWKYSVVLDCLSSVFDSMQTKIIPPHKIFL